MKRISAILFSLLLVWLQAAVAAPARAGSAQGTTCACRNCGKADCCVTPSSPVPAKTPVAPVRSGVQNEVSIPTPAALMWTLPVTEPQILPSSSASPRTATRVPLFVRYCARLI